MSPNLMLISKIMLTLLGTGTMAVGGTAPTDSVWIKIVAVLCGLIVLLMGVTFTTLIAHLVSHSKQREEIETIVDDHIEKQAELCSLTMGKKIDKIYKHVCGGQE